jgi:hypothetical protein
MKAKGNDDEVGKPTYEVEIDLGSDVKLFKNFAESNKDAEAEYYEKVKRNEAL